MRRSINVKSQTSLISLISITVISNLLNVKKIQRGYNDPAVTVPAI